MIAPARTAACAALGAINRAGVDLPTALARTREQLSDPRDRALAADIVAGTLRWRGALDHVIAHVAGRALDRIDPEILDILRVSLYQILHLTRVPASAVVDDAVDLARAARKPSATGFVNAVLRSVLRQRTRLPLPGRPEDLSDQAAAVAYLSITHSHPAWLVERWLDREGFDATETRVQFNNSTPAITLRANRRVTTREALAALLMEEDVETTPTRWSDDGLTVVSGNPVHSRYRALFAIQDEGSQLVASVVDARPDQRVLDLCAAPGGKTTAMSAAMRDTGLLVASVVRPRRMRLLGETVRASGCANVRLVQVDRTHPLPFSGSFDRVLVDAPCSGLGTIRRDPDIRWRRTAADLPALALAQAELLDRAADVVVPGGRLVYATCSSEPEENEAVADAFLARRADFRRVDLRLEAPAALQPLFDQDGRLMTDAARHGLEAFFATAMVRS